MRKYMLIIIFLVLLGCSANDIPKYDSMKISDMQISDEMKLEVVDFLKQAEITSARFVDDPDFTITAHKVNGYEDYYSVYLDKMLVYPNDSFHASFDNLSNKSSKCYQVTEENLWVFNKLNKITGKE